MLLTGSTVIDSVTFCGELDARESRIGTVAPYEPAASEPTLNVIVTSWPLTLVEIALDAVPVTVPTVVVPNVAPFDDVTVIVAERVAFEPSVALHVTDDADSAIVGVGGGETAVTFSVTVMFCGVLDAVASTTGTVAV